MAYVLGTLLLVTAGAMMLPVICSLLYGQEGDLVSLLIGAGVGAPLRWFFSGNIDLQPRHAFFVATFGWVSSRQSRPYVSRRDDLRPLLSNGARRLALCYFIVNTFMVAAGGLFMSIVDGMDATTAVSSVIATLMNIGPGFGDVGPTENFAQISDAGKWFLSFNMLVGRLEMFSALVLLYPSFWQK